MYANARSIVYERLENLSLIGVEIIEGCMITKHVNFAYAWA